jgi:hypothetical protein
MANSKKQTTSERDAGGQLKAGSGGDAGMTQAANTPNLGQGSPQGAPGMTTGTTGGGAATGTATARSLYDQAKETAGQAYEVAAEKATTKLEEKKTDLSGGLATIAGSVRQVSENLRGPDVQDSISKFTADYSQLAARKIENIANYFERKNVREMYSDLENFARRNPTVFVGGAFAVGLLAARFLKSGTSIQSGSPGNEFGYRPDRQTDDFGAQADISPV